ncbi:MAG TPA: YfiR family protein [Candidatus Baltobacteraceae bacterium]|nr:YfiR family protein [Candidatus Baltobacteraceae bacterium]
MALLTMTACRLRRWTTPGPRLAWLCGLVLLGFTSPAVAAVPAPSAEYQLKAVFLFNFAQFVEWPAQAYRDAKAPLVIGVLGEDPFGPYLDQLVRGEKVGDRPLVVRRFQRADDIKECHILFISRSEAASLGQIIGRLQGRSLLTVSDLDTFTRQGGIVRFVTENGKIRLRINVEAAKGCDLTISSKILRPATIVTADKD